MNYFTLSIGSLIFGCALYGFAHIFMETIIHYHLSKNIKKIALFFIAAGLMATVISILSYL